jgi:hypothetical protein
MSKEFLRFIQGSDDIAWDSFLQELKNMSFSSASRIGRTVCEGDVDEISSMFSIYLWENRDKRPLSEEECFSKLKRFVYEICAPGRIVSGLDERIECDSTTYHPKKEVSKCIFTEGLEKVSIHPRIKEEYLRIVDICDPANLFELCERQSFLGQLLLSILLKKHEVDVAEIESTAKNLYNIKECDDSVYLACLVVKFGKPWPICAYTLWGSTLFSSMASFMGPILVPGHEKYFRNLFLSIRVFLEVERYKKSLDESEALRETSWRLGIRMRDVIRRYDKIKRIISKYNLISESYAQQLMEDYHNLFSIEKQQICFESNEGKDGREQSF